MNPKHEVSLNARLDRVLDALRLTVMLREKATQGEWRFTPRGWQANTINVPNQPNRERPDFDSWITLNYEGGHHDATFIAHAANMALPTAKALILAIDWLTNDIAYMENENNLSEVGVLTKRAQEISNLFPEDA